MPARNLPAVLLFLLLLPGCLQTPATGPAPASCRPLSAHGARMDPTYDAILFDTDLGAITVILYNDSAPQSVQLMQAYVREGYYAGRSFERIVPGHVIQVTDAAGGATDDKRTVPLETSAAYHFSAGAVGIARGTDPHSGGPEIFIMDFATSHLDGNYTVLGQVVHGLDVVHQIARGPAIDFHALPGALGPAEPTDRMAVRPVTIRAASLSRVAVPAGIYPLQVARNQRAGEFRHSLEWPHTLAPGQVADLTWYMRPYNATSAPDATHVQVRIDGRTLPVVGDAAVAGSYRFSWTPPDVTPHNATALIDGKAVATLTIRAC